MDRKLQFYLPNIYLIQIYYLFIIKNKGQSAVPISVNCTKMLAGPASMPVYWCKISTHHATKNTLKEWMQLFTSQEPPFLSHWHRTQQKSISDE